MKRVSEALSALVDSDAEPLSDDARAAIREGLSHGRPPGYEHDLFVLRVDVDRPGLPLGWEGVEPVV